MNLLPFIDRSKKGCRFSNPLTGVLYNNNNYLKQCHYQLDPQNNNNAHAHGHTSTLVNVNGIRRVSLHMGRSLVDSSYLNNKQQRRSLYNNTHVTTTTNNNAKKNKYSTTANNINKSLYYKASDSKINYTTPNTQKNSTLQQQQTKNSNTHQNHTQNHQNQKNIFKFQDIEVKLIDQIKSHKDFLEKNVRINLGHYFGMFFRKNLAGPLTHDLMEIVQKYLQILSSKGTLDSSVQTKDYPAQYFTITNKRNFVERIQELQHKKSYKPIEQMIKYYCVPTKQFRQSCFRDILHMLGQSLYEKFSMSKDREYILLDQNGKQLQDICQIKFSTTLLLITNNKQYEKAYGQYESLIKSNLQNFKKMTFSEELKRNFRSKISGKVQETNNGPTHSQLVQNQQRRKFAQSKLQMHRNSDKSLQKFSPSKTTNNFGSKSRQKLKNLNRQSKSSLSKPTSLNQIPATKTRTLSGKKRDQLYQKQFQRLYFLNSTVDVSYNHYNDKQVLMKVFKKQFKLFKNKTQQQIDAIIQAFKLSPKNQSLNWQQFQKINQVSNCKGDNTHIVEFVTQYLPFNQYGQLDKEHLHKTIKFILNNNVEEDVVLEIIWSWLEKNNLISNNVVVRNTLESWYDRNKMAFVIVVSLVFGTNQVSWIDMAYEVLV